MFYRTYKGTKNNDGSREILAWIDKRCIDCGKFISKFKQFLCDKCYEKRQTKQKLQLHLERRNLVEYYMFQSIREATETFIPNYLYKELQVYL